ncbi:fibronectin type III domain protein [bacterium BMS3Abin03]|nr:fibronectin type III domain protein [bacterium BMS3Abin03]
MDQNKELYVLTFNPDKIYRFTPTAAIVAPAGLNGLASITLGVPPEVIVDLWWKDNSDNEDGFIIERKTGNGNFSAIDSVGANQTAFTDRTVLDTTTYTYRIAAYNATDVSGYSNEFTTTTPLRTLAPPTDLIATASGPNEVQLSWTDNSFDEVGFKIERKTGAAGSYSVIDSVAENITAYNDQSVAANTLYYYRVFAYLDDVIVSDYSNEDSAKTPLIVQVEDEQIPTEYDLKQNYPNPFNPSTKIKFSLPETSEVNIIIYNSLGKTIDTINQNVMQPGNYEQTWNAHNLSSGIYYLKMTAESTVSDRIFQNVIKMILLK